jgi:hypothetical protein
MSGGKMLSIGSNIKVVKLFAAFLLLGVGGASAQLTDDPRQVPLPDRLFNEPNRAVVVSVQFNSGTEVVLDHVLVANTAAKSSIGAPPLILLELLNKNGQVIAEQNAWHPLWVEDWDETGIASSHVEPTGKGTFYVPLSETLHSVRISDIQLAIELITVDVSPQVLHYCASTPATPVCALFVSGFE